MSKLLVEVELDWIGEDGSLDEILKEELISGVANRVSANAIAGIENKINIEIQRKSEEALQKADEAINSKLAEVLDDFLNRKRTVTDKWGDVKKADVSVMDMLKTACDEFIERKVDKSGKPITTSYYGGETMSQVEYLIKKNIDYKMEKSVENAAQQIKEGIQKYVDETLKAKIGDNIAKAIGLEKIVGKI